MFIYVYMMCLFFYLFIYYVVIHTYTLLMLLILGIQRYTPTLLLDEGEKRSGFWRIQEFPEGLGGVWFRVGV